MIKEEKMSAAKSCSNINNKNINKEESNSKKESADFDNDDICLIISAKTRATILAKRKH